MLTAVVAALLMEPVAALTHRLVMHRPRGWAWHRSHHAPRPPERWTEANDRFPLVFAAATVAVMAAGGPAVRLAGAGVAAYGLSYAVVHDVCIHGRLTGGRPVVRGGRRAASGARRAAPRGRCQRRARAGGRRAVRG